MAKLDSTPADGGTVSDKPAPKGAAEFFSNEEEDSEATTSDHAGEEDGESAVEQADKSEEREADEAKGEEGTEAEESEDDEAKKDESEPSKSVDVKIDGKSYTLDEVKRGFMREADYTRKTQQLASEKVQFNAAIERLGDQDKVARQTIELAQSIIQAAVPPEPNIDMLDTDPVGFQKAHYAREQAIRLINELHSKGAQIDKQAGGRQDEVTKEQLDNELRIALEKIPELRTNDGKAKFRDEAIKYGKHWDLTTVEVDSITSAKELAVLKDAIAYRKLMAEKPKAVEKVKTAPKIKIAKPGTREQRTETAMSKLQKLGRKAQARDYFTAMEED